MTLDTPKRLRMFAGPNGSGKTTLVQTLSTDFSAKGLFHLHHFINADNLFRALQEGRGIPLNASGRPVSAERIRAAIVAAGRLPEDHPFLDVVQVIDSHLVAPAGVCDGYVAAAIADFLREELLAVRQSFSFETVMSHRSKIDFFARARGSGYRTYLYFIATDSVDVNVSRVQNRTALGGHDVPRGKIAERYGRCLDLLGEALSHAHRAFLFDNSGADPIWLAQLLPEGEFQLNVPADSLPDWFRTSVAPHYPGLIPYSP